MEKEIKNYTINYFTGVEFGYVTGTLDEAITVARENARYTGNDIYIYEGEIEAWKQPVAIWKWYALPFDADLFEAIPEDNVIEFGDYGHYCLQNPYIYG